MIRNLLLMDLNQAVEKTSALIMYCIELLYHIDVHMLHDGADVTKAGETRESFRVIFVQPICMYTLVLLHDAENSSSPE